MLHYTSLFDDLEHLFNGATRDPDSFRRLAREVARVEQDLADYCQEVSADYVLRLEQRLRQPSATLSDDDADLLRSFLGIAAPDPERDQQLVQDLARVEESVAKLLELKDRSLSLKRLSGLRRLLGQMAGLLPRIVATLEERQRLEQFERAVGRGNAADGAERDDSQVLDRDWLLRAIRRATVGDDEPTPSEEGLSPFV